MKRYLQFNVTFETSGCTHELIRHDVADKPNTLTFSGKWEV